MVVSASERRNKGGSEHVRVSRLRPRSVLPCRTLMKRDPQTLSFTVQEVSPAVYTIQLHLGSRCYNEVHSPNATMKKVSRVRTVIIRPRDCAGRVSGLLTGRVAIYARFTQLCSTRFISNYYYRSKKELEPSAGDEINF